MAAGQGQYPGHHGDSVTGPGARAVVRLRAAGADGGRGRPGLGGVVVQVGGLGAG